MVKVSQGLTMVYVAKLMIASAVTLIVAGLAIAYTPWGMIGNSHDVVLFLYLAIVTVALPGASWWTAMRLMRML